MANEWTKVELFGANNDGQPLQYAIADGVAVSRGALLALLDPRAASNALVGSVVYAGIANMDKEASDGSTSISVITQGIFEAVASGAITLGAPVTGAEANKVRNGAGTSGAAILGYCMETAADGETVNIRLNL